MNAVFHRQLARHIPAKLPYCVNIGSFIVGDLNTKVFLGPEDELNSIKTHVSPFASSQEIHHADRH